MKCSNIFQFILIIVLSLFFHILFGYSMMDVLYKFPLNYGMPPHSASLSDNETLSDRVVILAFDGFRADTFFETINFGKNPYLQKIIRERGVYGVSHLKAPTETKPCFTAMCTGHFQDGSLALKHIFNQFVVSDSIFNQSNHAWGIGFIINVFTEQAKQMENLPLGNHKYNKIFYISYDFNIFHGIIDFLNNAKKDKNGKDYKNLNKKKITFLMHITETDGLGHTYGPKADILRNHLIDLDKYFQALENAFYEFYHDNRTTFLLTSDHGMNLNKYHGDDTEACKRVPFMAWGAGIRKSIHREKKPGGEDSPEDWGVDNYVRRDVEEIDFTPLTAGLIDINFPMNSYGKIPLDILDTSDKIKSKLLFTNFMEIFEIYKMKNGIKSKSKLFSSYKPLSDSENQIIEIKNDIENGKYLDAIDKTDILIKKTLDGIDYLLKYDTLLLKVIVFIGYVLWMLYLLIFLEMKNNDCMGKLFFYNCEEKVTTIIFGILTIISFVYLLLRNSPSIYYFYISFPLYFGWRIFSNLEYLKSFFFKYNDFKMNSLNLIMLIVAIVLFFSLVSYKINNFNNRHLILLIEKWFVFI